MDPHGRSAPELGKAAGLAGDRTFSTALARAYSRSGYAGTLKELIRHQLRDRAGEHYGSAAEIARLYSALGQKRAALNWLEKAGVYSRLWRPS